MQSKLYYIVLCVLLASCSGHVVSVKNPNEGKLTATHQLVASGEKKFLLDTETAQKPTYIQLVRDSSETLMLTFLNTYKNAIYFYDYSTTSYIGNIGYQKEGPNAILALTGYYIKNMDSIYVYNMPLTEIVLTDSVGQVKRRTSLRGDDRSNWSRYYPQYVLNTAIPLIENRGKLMLTGMSPFSISDSLINKFCFATYLDTKTNQVEFRHTYPEALYGRNSNWEGGMHTQAYFAISSNDELIYSFPVSHDLYIQKDDQESYTTVYGGSNVAGTIHSINWDPKTTPEEVIVESAVRGDMYGPILFDPYRNVYYRILLQGIPDATARTPLEKKPVIVIMMDEHFNYLGETTIGRWEEWNWMNSFVTEEGLSMEYTGEQDFDEDYLRLKIFTVEKL